MIRVKNGMNLVVKHWDQVLVPALALGLGAFIMAVMLDAISKF